MITLVYGGSGSGKSEYAENVVLNQSEPGNRYYIATMKAAGEEGEQRIARHRKLRSGKGFQTIECPRDIPGVLEQIPDIPKATILVECVSNLLANEMFDLRPDQTAHPGIDEAKTAVSRVLDGLALICSRAENTVLVTNNIFEDGICYDEMTMQYMKSLGLINRQLAEMADYVTEVVAGIPIPLR